jgi:hypothetical protein
VQPLTFVTIHEIVEPGVLLQEVVNGRLVASLF